MKSALLLWLVLLLSRVEAAIAPAGGMALSRTTNGTVLLTTFEASNNAVRLEFSSDLMNWREVAQVDSQAVDYEVAMEGGKGYFRARTAENGAAPVYSHQLHQGHWWWMAGEEGLQPRWSKFVINLAEPEKVYFQNMRVPENYLHYTFVTRELPGFAGISEAEFNEISLRTNAQQLLLGTVLLQPARSLGSEIGIQFVGNDAYSPGFLLEMLERVSRRINKSPNARVMYFPEYEQLGPARTHAATFREAGFEVSSIDRWIMGDFTYSEGWAVGVLKFYKIGETEEAYRTGALTEQDILLTDYIPADLPKLAGILSLNPASPGSHVAILAQNRGIPFGYLSSAELIARAHSFVGQEVLVEARNQLRGDDIRIIEGGSRLNAVREQLLGLKRTPPLKFPPKAEAPVLTALVDNLTKDDVRYFGGKAANFSMLRAAIPNHSPAAIAFSFNLWDRFMNVVTVNGRSLRAEIAARLESLQQTSNRLVTASILSGIQKLIKDASFPEELKPEVVAALSPFDRSRNIRFRSSTNVEDGEEFTGAGLYDSYSGCLADDLDGNTAGPSGCDPLEEDERGVFRAIQKVFASFYNENAYWARREYQVDETQAGMALVVHHSFPDEIELANGAATFRCDLCEPGILYSTSYRFVTQKGAASVTNPDGSSLPEIVNGGRWGYNYMQQSSLVPLGTRVMEGEDYQELQRLLALVALEYQRRGGDPRRFALEFEFKKTAAGLVVKQVRKTPAAASNSGEQSARFAVDEESRLETEQEQFGTIYANHQVKAKLSLKVNAMSLDEPESSLYSEIDIAVLEGSAVRRYKGEIAALPGYRATVASNLFVHEFRFVNEPAAPVYRLRTKVLEAAPIQTVNDWEIELEAELPEPALVLLPVYKEPLERGTNAVYFTNRFVTKIHPVQPLDAKSILVYRESHPTNSVKIRTEYYWAELPETQFGGLGFTSALIRWNMTRIEGLSSVPIILRDPFAQSYKCQRKNRYEEFCFEPGLDPELPEQVRTELEEANVRTICIYCRDLAIIGFDDQVRVTPINFSGFPFY